MESKRNVLIIAYYFPPMGLSGVQRTLKFAKYLPEFGWAPTILTVTPTGYYAQDYTLLDEVHDPDIEIVRVGSLDPNRLFRRKGVVRMPSERWRKALTYMSDWFFIPDNKRGWRHKAFRAAKEIASRKQFDVIFATAPPYTDFLIGADLAAEIRKPLILDYRDAWHEYPYKYYPTLLHKWLNYRLEKRVLRTSTRIITTNRRVKEMILKRFKFLTYHDVTILPQGFDPEDFPVHVLTGVRPKDRMTITHAGVFYGERTPLYLFQALQEAFQRQPAMRNRVEVKLIGTLQDEHVATIRSMNLEGTVTVTGYLDHPHCVKELAASDVLWLMLGNDSQSPGKLYEYLGARRTILANVPEGFIRQTLQETGGAIITGPQDVAAIADALVKLFGLFTANALPRPDEAMVEKYNRVELTRELSRIFGFLAE